MAVPQAIQSLQKLKAERNEQLRTGPGMLLSRREVKSFKHHVKLLRENKRKGAMAVDADEKPHDRAENAETVIHGPTDAWQVSSRNARAATDRLFADATVRHTGLLDDNSAAAMGLHPQDHRFRSRPFHNHAHDIQSSRTQRFKIWGHLK